MNNTSNLEFTPKLYDLTKSEIIEKYSHQSPQSLLEVLKIGIQDIYKIAENLSVCTMIIEEHMKRNRCSIEDDGRIKAAIQISAVTNTIVGNINLLSEFFNKNCLWFTWNE